jgi:hypothetical protein
MPSSSPHRHRPPRAHDVIDPALSPSPRCHRPHNITEPTMPSTLHRPWAHNTIILPEPTTPLTSCHPRAHNNVVLPQPMSSPSPHCYIVYFSMSFWAYKSGIWYATLLWYVTLPHCYDMLHTSTLLWYSTLPDCFDMLRCHIALICYIVTLLHFFYSATFLSIWIYTTLLSDESGLSEMSVATCTNIILLGF